MSPAHCCKWCRNESGKHGKKCERSCYIPAPSEWEYNDWLANGSPSKFALLLPNERDAFMLAGLCPQTYNTPPSFAEVSQWRKNVPRDTITPPASDNEAPAAPPVTDNATLWRFIMPYVLEHGPEWTVQDHWGYCGMGCPCCRSHAIEDGSCCDECYDGWVLTTVCKSFKTYAQ